jgi:NAD(P)-dependent dehydrogenase (short-subunit alcohol dehydrogenase family)
VSGAQPQRVALVTGASSGIGAAIARTLSAAGFAVALAARRADRLAALAREIEAAGGRASAHPVDLADATAIDACFDAAEAALGPIDTLVNNAGISVPGLLHEVAPADFAREIAVNLVAPALLARRAIAGLRARDARGDLVFVSSENAVAPRPYQPGYTASKWGLEGLARTLKLECEGTGIRSTIVRPGPTFPTDFANGWDPALVRRLLETWSRLGIQRHLRWMPADSVAHAVLAVVSAPPGTHLDVLQLGPEAPPELRLGGNPP